jgi:Rrf2 family protein
MLGYGKRAQNAIAAVSYLAGLDVDSPPASSEVIARSRKLPKPLVAKVLTILSQAGLVKGSPGPGGGYRLARPAAEVSLLDVVRHFERVDVPAMCPLGPDWCGKKDENCPLHERLLELHGNTLAALKQTTFVGFEKTGPMGH